MSFGAVVLHSTAPSFSLWIFKVDPSCFIILELVNHRTHSFPSSILSGITISNKSRIHHHIPSLSEWSCTGGMLHGCKKQQYCRFCRVFIFFAFSAPTFNQPGTFSILYHTPLFLPIKKPQNLYNFSTKLTKHLVFSRDFWYTDLNSKSISAI